jgi:hypothetical protein
LIVASFLKHFRGCIHGQKFHQLIIRPPFFVFYDQPKSPKKLKIKLFKTKFAPKIFSPASKIKYNTNNDTLCK